MRRIIIIVLGFTFLITNDLSAQDKREKPVFQLENPDFIRSPHTGMTKKHWEDAALYILEGAFSYIKTLDDPMKFPKLPGKSYPHDEGKVPTEKLEGLSRTLFVAATLLKKNPNLEINGIKVADYYKHQLVQLINPESSAFIVPRAKNGGPSQNLVEYGALAMSLFIAPDVIWEPLSKVDKDGLAASMLSYADGPTVDSNWKFFNIFVLSFFDEQGYEVNRLLLEKYVQESLKDYRGEGWYNDHPAYDYYSMWAFQLYGILWSQLYGDENYPEYAKGFRSNFSDLTGNYPYLFAKDGKMIMWGRSISYRIASISPLPFTGLLEAESINYGWMRRIASGTLLQFLQNPDFLKDQVPTLGFYGHFEPAVQEYSARGSVYWMGKAFFGLLIPDDNPFWTATENEGSWEDTFKEDQVYNKFQEASNILITNYPALGASEIRAWCHERKVDDWQHFRSSENYNKLSYNSEFPWQADGENGEISMNYSFLNDKKEWEPLRLYTFKKFENGIYYRDAVLETNDQVKMQLAEMPLPNGILRVDKNISSVAVAMRLGHYALPRLEVDVLIYTKRIKGHEIQIIDNGVHQLALVSLKGWEHIETLETEGLHPVSDHSTVSNVSGVFNPEVKSTTLYASLILWKKSGESWSNEELMPIHKIKTISTNKVQVSLKNGKQYTFDFH
tara:strand:- start:20924 stop:22942 length:2019 start_codon:yes stop_codon:yes gene_type:complete